MSHPTILMSGQTAGLIATVLKVQESEHTARAGKTVTLSPAAVPEPPVATDAASCPEHGKSCAFWGDEPNRCPWCHSKWSAISSSGWHSCEKARTWRGKGKAESAWRLIVAATMRENAAEKPQEVQEDEHTARAGKSAVRTGGKRAERVKGSKGTRSLVEVECNGCPRSFGVMVETIAFVKCSQCRQAVSYAGAGRPGWNKRR